MTGKEFRIAFENSGMNGADFAEKIGVARSSLYRLFDEKKVDSFYVDNFKKMSEKKTNSTLPLIPIEAFAGSARGFTDAQYHEQGYHVPDFVGKADFLVKISGNSMAPKYYNGDVVACKLLPTLDFVQWGKVYVLNTNQGPIIKRLQKSDKKDSVLAVSENAQQYPAFDVPLKSISAFAIVVGVVRVE